jgi:colanic acid/amylovoran biosynthesis glycosyltransferase
MVHARAQSADHDESRRLSSIGCIRSEPTVRDATASAAASDTTSVDVFVDTMVQAKTITPLRMAYLSSRHPTLSMIFVVREIAGLEALGFDIEIASINDSDRPIEKLTAVEAEQSKRTYYVIAHGVLGALAAHGSALLRRPARYLRGWGQAMKLAGFDLRAIAMHAAYLTEALMVGRWMQRRALKHLHVHLGSQPATVGLLVKHVFDIGFSITVHGADEFYDAFRQHLPEKVAGADFIVCISHFARSQLMFVSHGTHWHKLTVSRLGIDVSHFAPLEYKRKRSDEPFHILCVGRLAAAKGQQLLIDAVGRLKAMGRPVTLDLVGAGVNADLLKEQVRKKGLQDTVVLSGPVNQDRILEHYKRADCFAIPSFAEGIPVVLMEAMSMQIPCVTSNITGIPELITTERTGLLTPASDVDALVAQIDRLIMDPALAKRLGEAARVKVLSDYDLDEAARSLALIFSEHVEPSPAAPA